MAARIGASDVNEVLERVLHMDAMGHNLSETQREMEQRLEALSEEKASLATMLEKLQLHGMDMTERRKETEAIEDKVEAAQKRITTAMDALREVALITVPLKVGTEGMWHKLESVSLDADRKRKSGKKAPAAAVAATPAHAHKAEVVAEVDSNAVDYDEGAGEEAPVEAGGKCGGEVEAVGEGGGDGTERDGVDDDASLLQGPEPLVERLDAIEERLVRLLELVAAHVDKTEAPVILSGDVDGGTEGNHGNDFAEGTDEGSGVDTLVGRERLQTMATGAIARGGVSLRGHPSGVDEQCLSAGPTRFNLRVGTASEPMAPLARKSSRAASRLAGGGEEDSWDPSCEHKAAKKRFALVEHDAEQQAAKAERQRKLAERHAKNAPSERLMTRPRGTDMPTYQRVGDPQFTEMHTGTADAKPKKRGLPVRR